LAQNSGEMALKPLTILKTLIVDPSSPNSAKVIQGCLGGMNDSIPFPSSCYLRFGHQDVGKPIRYVDNQMDKPGYKGLTLVGNVDSNDKFYVGGTCSSTAPGSMEEYIKACSFDIGMRDNTYNSNYALNSSPASQASHPMNSVIWNATGMTGDVNSDDSFYFRFRCNTPGNDKAKYFYENCYVCFGYSDIYRPQPDVKVCSPITTYASAKWSRFGFTGDVNSDDIMYLGFTCRNSSTDVVFDIQ